MSRQPKLNRTSIKAFYLIVFCFLCIASAAHPQQNDSLIYTITEITIASEPDYPPYCIVNEDGNADGFSIDLFKAAAQAVGIDVNIKIGVWDKIKQDLAKGKIDALPLVGRTPEREDYYDFTLPYLRLHGAIFIRKDTKNIETIEDLKGKTIAVMEGDNAEEYIRRNSVSNRIIATHTFEDAFRLLEEGNADAVITQRITGLELLKKMGIKNITPLETPLHDFRQDFCFAVQKGDTELLSLLNEGLSIVIANNTFNEIHLKWFGPQIKERLSIKDIVRIGLTILIPITIVLSFILIIILRKSVKSRTRSLELEIDKHKETYQTLLNQQQLLEKMERTAKIGGWEYNIKNDKIIWTKGVYEIYGVNPDEFDSSRIDKDIQFYNPDNRETLEIAFSQLLKTGEPYDLELPFTSANGQNKWVWTSGQAELRDNKVFRVYGIIMDITKNKMAELSIAESADKIKEIFNSTNEAIFIHDAATGKINDINHRSLELYGFSSKDEIINGNVGDISANEHPYTQTKAEEYLQKAITEGPHSFDWLARKKNGETFWAEISLRYFEWSNQKLIIAVIRNVTERKKAENELLALKNQLELRVEERTRELDEQVKKLEKSQKAMLFMVEDLNTTTADLKSERRKLEISNKELEAFSYSVSHDLRAPLRAIDGFSRIILEDYHDNLDNEGQRLLGVVRENVQRMDKLITDLLSLSRATRTEMNVSKVDMTGMANSIYHEVLDNENPDDISINISPLPHVYADTSLIRQVWHNLIGNAIKYSKPKGNIEIDISAVEDDEMFTFCVKDSGVGFNPSYKNKIFDTFQRLHKSDKFEGTGVGLSIVQRIVARHGGRVWADSVEGEGASFCFSLPKGDWVTGTQTLE
ncbi:MAG: transporter substrate-binding domain-containing protein [Perlabentimonas sp.]